MVHITQSNAGHDCIFHISLGLILLAVLKKFIFLSHQRKYINTTLPFSDR